MRTLRFFFSSFLTIAILCGVIFFVGRELLLFFAATQIKTSISRMEKASGGGEYREECTSRANLEDSRTSIKEVHLRFISDTEYVTEVICTFNASSPLQIESEHLPLWVRKIPGESGLIWDTSGKSGIAIEILGRKNTIILDGSTTVISNGRTPIEGNHPVSVCQGFGFQCCDPITRIGEGQPIAEGVSDCPQQCFAQCQPRPVVLRLYSDPVPDSRTRTVSIGKNGQVTFYYTLDVDEVAEMVGTINFGDGTSEPLMEVEGTVTHTYQCAQPSCFYQATITAIDVRGNSSISTAVSTLQVQVQ